MIKQWQLGKWRIWVLSGARGPNFSSAEEIIDQLELEKLYTMLAGWEIRKKFSYYWIAQSFFRKTEKWTIDGDEITKEILNLPLNDYSTYPELFAVKQNYCTFV